MQEQMETDSILIVSLVMQHLLIRARPGSFQAPGKEWETLPRRQGMPVRQEGTGEV